MRIFKSLETIKDLKQKVKRFFGYIFINQVKKKFLIKKYKKKSKTTTKLSVFDFKKVINFLYSY